MIYYNEHVLVLMYYYCGFMSGVVLVYHYWLIDMKQREK